MKVMPLPQGFCYRKWRKPGMQSKTIFSDSLKGTFSRLFDCFDKKKNSSNLPKPSNAYLCFSG